MLVRAIIVSLGVLLLPVPGRTQEFVANPWPEADQLFRRDLRWLGGDDAYSVDLGKGRVLWLFGDSWIASRGQQVRTEATMISNSIAVQQGCDPTRASIEYYWSHRWSGRAAPFFEPPDRGRLWPGHGVRLGDRLLLFFMRVRSTTAGLGFEVYDWTAVLVTNPDDAPSHWRLTWLETPRVRSRVIVGSGGVFVEAGFVYAFSSQEPAGPHRIYLVRWAVADARAGRLSDLQWWCGERGWEGDRVLTGEPTAVLTTGQTEFTVHRDSGSGRYVHIQTDGFGPAVISLRTAANLTGPWSEPHTMYVPPEDVRPRIMVYAGKAHPELCGADLIVTYATNTFDFAEQVRDMSLYFPRFVRLNRQRP